MLGSTRDGQSWNGALAPDAAPQAVRRGWVARGKRGLWRCFARTTVRVVGLLVILHLFFVNVSVVRGHSMDPSLADGDRLVVDRVGYRIAGVDRFDVVVLRYPRDPSVDFVKRIVGLPGDRVRLDGDGLFVNDEQVTQSFAHVQDPAGMDERIVPPDSYFVLGDNRPISCDSREFGVVPADLLRGTVRARFWPFSSMGIF